MERDSGNTVVWFLTGAAIGAAVALLYAPQSGEKTRKLIARRANEGGKELLDRGRDIYDRGREFADEAAEIFERGKKLVQS